MNRLGGVGEVVDAASGAVRFAEYEHLPTGEVSREAVWATNYAMPGGGAFERRDTVYQYDALGRRTTVTYAAAPPNGDPPALPHGSPVVATGYDAFDRPVRVTDPRGVVTTLAYDVLGRERSATRGGEYPADANPADGPAFEKAVTTSEYDAADQLLSQTDPTGRVTSYAYDQRGRRTLVVEGHGGADERASGAAYRPDGEVRATVDTRGTTTAYGYDAADRVVEEVWTGGGGPSSVGRAFAYDAAGRLTTAASAGGMYTLTYDPAGRVETVAGPVTTLTFGYDEDGRRTSIVDGSGAAQSTAYDAVGRVYSRTLYTAAASMAASYAYDDRGLVDSVSGR